MEESTQIEVHNLSNLPVEDFSVFRELQQDFKQPSPLQTDKLAQTILKRGFKYAFIAWKSGDNLWIVDAHQRKSALYALQQKGFTIPPVPYYLVQASSKKEAVEEIAYINSHYAEINPDTSLFDDYDIDLSELDIELPELDFDVHPVAQRDSASLSEKFLVPPFSVFDSRQGYWQERKANWIHGLGIRSELGGRDKLKTSGSLSGTIPGYYDKKALCEQKLGKELSNKEFEENHLKDYIPESSIIATTSTGGILSVFDPVLTEIIYRWFTPDEGTIYDPFAGGSVRGIVAAWLGYHYLGVDLRVEQVEENYNQAQQILDDHPQPKWIVGNSINTDQLIQQQVDLVFSCPPYFDLEIYSEDEQDLSNLSWDDFKSQYVEIIEKSCEKLREDRFACFVVGDVRDSQGVYRNFIDLTKKAFIDAGLHFYNEIILVNVAGSLPVRAGRQFNATRKVGKMHQNVLVFYKGNPKEIKEHFNQLDFSNLQDDE